MITAVSLSESVSHYELEQAAHFTLVNYNSCTNMRARIVIDLLSRHYKQLLVSMMECENVSVSVCVSVCVCVSTCVCVTH